MIDHGIESGYPKRIMIKDVMRAVAKERKLSRKELLSDRKTAYLVRSRHIGWYLCRTLTARSLIEIGYYFGGRDHTSVLHGINKIAELKERDNDLNQEIDKVAFTAVLIAFEREVGAM
jgi:chromosomal replication initiator protein